MMEMLIARKIEIEESYKTFNERLRELDNERSNIMSELLRLEGAYREIEKFMAKEEENMKEENEDV